jgi:hypothetical protein
MFQKTRITTEDLERLDILRVRRDKETRYERIMSDDEVQAPRHQAKNLAIADRQSFSKDELSDLVGAILGDDDKLFGILVTVLSVKEGFALSHATSSMSEHSPLRVATQRTQSLAIHEINIVAPIRHWNSLLVRRLTDTE